MKSTYLFAVLFLAALLAAAAFMMAGEQAPASADDGSSPLEGVREMWGYPLKEVSRRGSIVFMEYLGDAERIELNMVGGVDEETANESISDQVLLFKSVFEIKSAPYPGQQTRYIECPEEFKPKYLERDVDGGTLAYFIGYSNSNFVPGACSSDLIVYRSVNGWLYCRGAGDLIDFDYFVPVNDTLMPEAFIDKIGCQYGDMT